MDDEGKMKKLLMMMIPQGVNEKVVFLLAVSTCTQGTPSRYQLTPRGGGNTLPVIESL